MKKFREETSKNKDKQIEEQQHLMEQMKNTMKMHHTVVFYSIDEDRRCLGEYEKLSEEESKEEYEKLLKEKKGFLAESDIFRDAPIYKQKEGNYKLIRIKDVWQVGSDSISYQAHSENPTLFPPNSGWKDENNTLIPSITVNLSGTIPCEKIKIEYVKSLYEDLNKQTLLKK